MTLFVVPNGITRCRLGVAATRKLGSAVVRNRAKRLARELQANAWDYVHHLYLGQFFRGSAWRKTVTGVIGMPEIVPFWNMEKAG